jgi:hypothetical protein
MRKIALVGLALGLVGGCGLPAENHPAPAENTVAVTQPSPEPRYCFIPEGCDVGGHHYEAGQQLRPADR